MVGGDTGKERVTKEVTKEVMRTKTVKQTETITDCTEEIYIAETICTHTTTETLIRENTKWLQLATPTPTSEKTGVTESSPSELTPREFLDSAWENAWKPAVAHIGLLALQDILCALLASAPKGFGARPDGTLNWSKRFCYLWSKVHSWAWFLIVLAYAHMVHLTVSGPGGVYVVFCDSAIHCLHSVYMFVGGDLEGTGMGDNW